MTHPPACGARADGADGRRDASTYLHEHPPWVGLVLRILFSAVLGPTPSSRFACKGKKCVHLCVPVQGQEIKIRIISTEYKKYARDFEYRYEVIDNADASFRDVDFVRHDQVLSRNKCLLVRFNADQRNPRIEEVVEELDPTEYK